MCLVVIVQTLNDLELFNFLKLIIPFFFSPVAFTKLITVNGQEYHLQLVDTAGQVSDIGYLTIPYSTSDSPGPGTDPHTYQETPPLYIIEY